MQPPIHLGPFEIHEVIGHGGMGEVWKGIHAQQQVEVAVKVLTAERARDTNYHKGFRNEVRAVAQLDHPGIVMVLDHGTIDDAAAEASQGQMVAGSPYLVMELASIGVLSDVEGPLSWKLIRRILLELLEGLGHAHARGTVHRDLKPGNVLLTERRGDDPPGRGWSCKLTDFGIAHAIDRSTLREIDEIAGTPDYMAPEQLRGAWRDYGPWTDLYALGCMAYELVCGQPPFHHKNLVTVIHKHVSEPPPSLRPLTPIPSGLDAWLRRLLEKTTDERFRRAADAAAALEKLPEVPQPAGSSTSIARYVKRSTAMGVGHEHEGERGVSTLDSDINDAVSSQTASLQRNQFVLASTLDSSEFPVVSEETLSASDLQRLFLPGHALPVESPMRFSPSELSIPSTWRSPEPPPPPMQLVGAGLGLYGLRPVRLVDRISERDGLWHALLDVRQTRLPSALLLRGPAGTGKSRLAEWLAQRAHELGAAIVLKATHSPIAGPADGLPRMVAQYLRCIGLDREQTLARTEKIVAAHNVRGPTQRDSYEGLALTELMEPSRQSSTAIFKTEGALTSSLSAKLGDLQQLAEANESHELRRSLRFNSPDERHIVLTRLLRWFCRERPVILWMEDIQWGSDAIDFTQFLLKNATDVPVLVVMTTRDEDLQTRPLEADQLDELMAHPRSQVLEIPPLSPDDHAILVERLLGLKGTLARRVMERTAGNPLFAVQLVGDWVARGVLEVTRDGFQLKTGERAQLPDDIHDLFTSTVEHLFSAYPTAQHEDLRIILELAAALGKDVDIDEWIAVCHHIGLEIPGGFLDALVQAHLVTLGETSWTFTHGMFRESLRRSAREAHRWQNHHRICAAMLTDHHGDNLEPVSERLGMHMLAAREFASAIDYLLQAAEQRLISSGFIPAHGLFALREDAIRALQLPASDRRCALGWVKQARAYYLQGKSDEAEQLIDATESNADPENCADLLAQALFLRARITYERGDRAEGIALAREAMDRFHQLGDLEGRATARRQLGEYYQQSGDIDRAQHYYIDAVELWSQLHEHTGGSDAAHSGLGRAYTGIASALIATNKTDDAPQFLDRALSHFEAANNRYHAAWCINTMGELARSQNRPEEATERYRDALTLLDQMGDKDAPIVRFNLAMVLLTRRDFVAARREFRALEDFWVQTQKSFYLPYVHAALLACAAAHSDWERWDALITTVESELRDSELVDDDIASSARLAGELARDSGDPARANHAFTIAYDQWRALGRLDKLDELDSIIRSLTL